jgi:16S rRNA (guanine527-N7)-methyltransferase
MMAAEHGPDLVYRYFPDLSERQRQQIEHLEAFFSTWNPKINLISRKDADRLYERHVLHALSIAKYISLQDGCRVLDAGTGGGFPGIPLAIFFPGVQFVLADSIGKKIRTVGHLAGELGLSNVQVLQTRVEDMHDTFDYLTARAVTTLPVFCGWVQHLLRRPAHDGGILYLKGGDLRSELQHVPYKSRIIDLRRYFDLPFFDTKKLVHLY